MAEFKSLAKNPRAVSPDRRVRQFEKACERLDRAAQRYVAERAKSDLSGLRAAVHELVSSASHWRYEEKNLRSGK